MDLKDEVYANIEMISSDYHTVHTDPDFAGKWQNTHMHTY